MLKEYIEREAKVNKTIHYISSKKCLDTFFELFVMEDTRIAEASEEEIFRFQHALGLTPVADVKPVVYGEWIEYSGDPNIITCSECDWGTSPEEKGFKYCPGCGAKMDGDK